jgi:hypothetical protein
MAQFKNVLSVVEVSGAFAVAIDKVPTGEVFHSRKLATERVAEIRAERKAAKPAKK